MFNALSDAQREIVLTKSGNFVVRACPGSGKTFCVAARLARLIENWPLKYSGVAALSFTNVAWQEIEKKYRDAFNMGDDIPFPHFLGTIDSFINRFIFLPHGHLILKCPDRPILVGQPHGIWTGKFFAQSFFDNLTYNIEGNIVAISERKMPLNWKTNQYILNAKKELLKAGYATQSDANYFAMKVLEAFPQIAKSIARRFPYLIVDEAQDTSDIQMRIIDLLIENGLSEVMLVGDPDQAIFEWNDARPDLLIKKFDEWPASILLNENRRSSQHICNATFSTSSLVKPSLAVSIDVKDFTHKPSIITYNDNNLPQIVADFIKECESNGIAVSEKTTSIVYRSKGLINDITGIEELKIDKPAWVTHDNYSKDFARGKFLYDHGDYRNGFKSIEKALIKQMLGLRHCSEEDIKKFINKNGFIKFKSAVYKVIKSLPKTDRAIGVWIAEANVSLKTLGARFHLSINSGGQNYTFEQLFINDSNIPVNRGYRLGTVHSVKGETFDATLLILKTRGIGKAYKTLLKENVMIADSEELRIAYVGMTRPRKILVLAVPKVDRTAWQIKFSSIKVL